MEIGKLIIIIIITIIIIVEMNMLIVARKWDLYVVNEFR